MYFHRLASACLVAVSLIAGTLTAYAYQEQDSRRPKMIQRAKRPEFKERDWNGIYFENLFKEGVVGKRPVPSAVPAVKPNQVAGAQNTSPAGDPSANASGGSNSGWSQVIAHTVIEDEVKALQQKLSMDVTTPGRFKSDYGKVHQSYSMLSMLFGIILEYDADVRWKEMAPVAQPAFARAAANSRVGSLQAYNNAKLQKDNLTELVRGGGFGNQQKPVDAVDWASAVKRSPVMVQLEDAVAELKPFMANKTEFTQNNETVLHGASLIAAMGQVLCKPDMDDAEEEDYLVYAEAMKKAARQVVQGCETKNYELASEGFNLIEQSCSNCHDEWR